MLNKKFRLGMLIIVLIFGMAVIGCKDDTDNENGNNNDNSGGNGVGSPGTFTLTNIPSEHNGKYAALHSDNDFGFLFGAQRINIATETIIIPRISNGSVSMLMWIETNSDNYVRYSGNNTVGVWVGFYNSENYIEDEVNLLGGVEFKTVTFSNGSATISFNDGVFDWEMP
jgi:hypothetical protein